MTFDEWMELSEKVIGQEGLFVFGEFTAGNISFDECLERMQEVMPVENKNKLQLLIKTLETK